MHPPSLATLKRSWHALLNLGFSLLCIRFLYAAGQGADWTLVLLGATSFGLACWRPSASLFALILGFSLLSGLEKSTLFAPYSALLVVASSLWLGLALRRLLSASARQRPPEAAESTEQKSAWVVAVVDLLATLALVILFFQIWQQPKYACCHHSPSLSLLL